MAGSTYPRWQRRKIQRALERRRIVLLEGPRQCGKTTLAETFVSGDAIYRPLDEERYLQAAIEDPVEFVRHGDELMVIDEVQLAPGLLRAIKRDVDVNRGYGRYLLTGSVHIQSLPSVTDSLAGRIGKVRLRPLAMGEIEGRPADFITDAFKGVFKTPATPVGRAGGKAENIALAMRGGFPEAVAFGEAGDVRGWHEEYLGALLDRDLREIAKIRRRDGLEKLVEALAAWSSKEVDITKIGAAPRLARATIESYINALAALHLVERVRPWHSTDYNRSVKRDRIFMSDSGLMSSVLKWRFEEVRSESDLNGKLVETFAFNQLAAILEAQDEAHDLYHYRDKDGREVDLLVRNERGDLIGIEVKAGSSVNVSMFGHLDWFRGRFAEGRDFRAVVLYSGDEVLSFGNGRWAVPLAALWA